MEKHRYKVEDVISKEYGDFIKYCKELGKIYIDEVEQIDIVGFRSQYGYSREFVKPIMEIVENNKKSIAVQFNTNNSNSIVNDTPNSLTIQRTHLTRDLDDLRFIELYDIDLNNFKSYRITHIKTKIGKDLDPLSLSIRSKNALVKAGYNTLADLFSLSKNALMEISNLGKKSVDEICLFIESIAKQQKTDYYSLYGSSQKLSKIKEDVRLFYLKLELTKIINSLNSITIDYSELNASEISLITQIEQSVEDIGVETARNILLGEIDGQKALNVLHQISNLNASNEIRRELNRFYRNNRFVSNLPISPTIELFNRHNKIKIPINNSATYSIQFKDYNIYFKDEEYMNILINNGGISILLKFEKWIILNNPNALCQNMFNYSNDRIVSVFDDRLEGLSLEIIGEKYSVTRERIRQMEVKAISKVKLYLEKLDVDYFELIRLYVDNIYILAKEQLCSVIGNENGLKLWHCVKYKKAGKHVLDNEKHFYDEWFDVLIFIPNKFNLNKNGDLKTRIDKLISYIPEFLEISTLHSYLESISEQFAIPLYLLENYANDIFKPTGLYTSKAKITNEKICEFILKEHFKNGYKISNEFYSAKMIQYAKDLFSVDVTGRAVDVKVAAVGILCNRGKYIHPDNLKISNKELEIILGKIDEYIKNNSRQVITIAELYSVFEYDLQKINVKNKYLLQGLLKMHRAQYIYRKDYIQKAADTNIVYELENYIKDNGIVTTEEILKEFPGWKEYNIDFVRLRSNEIIKISPKTFVHSSSIIVSDEDKLKIKKILDELVSDMPVSISNVLNEFYIEMPQFIIDNKIESKDLLFRILKHLFNEEYHFSNYYITRDNSGKLTHKIVLLKYLEEVDSIEIDDLIRICLENNIFRGDRSLILDALRPEYIRIDKNTLQKPDRIGINEEIIQDICLLVLEEIQRNNGFVAANNINNLSWYPSLDVEWNAILLSDIVLMGIEKNEELGIGCIFLPYSRNLDQENGSTTIFVGEEYVGEEYNTFIVRALKKENETEPFTSVEEVDNWLQEKGLCFDKHPIFLDNEKILGVRNGNLFLNFDNFDIS